MKNPLDWNVLVTAQAGRQRELRGALARLVTLRRTPFPCVMVGRVEDFDAVAAAVETQRTQQPFLDLWLGRMLPIERTFRVDVVGFTESLAREIAPFVDRLAGRRFHVRVERRGHKGAIDSHLVEQEIGEHVRALLEQRGASAALEFDDPDVVLSVELLGDVGGIGLVTRELRARYPFVRID
jgi:tRNA(Ser,Leu) C12 N-acetylase TAN1